MIQKNAYSVDADDSSSNITVESDETDNECSTVRTKYENNLDVSRINASNLNLPGLPDKTSISHISSIALRNSTDITFGNRTLYSGSITVNQYGLGKTTASSLSKLYFNYKRLLRDGSVKTLLDTGP